MMSLWFVFMLSFIAGFITMWLATIESKDSFIIFESEEELQQACWEGLRKGLK